MAMSLTSTAPSLAQRFSSAATAVARRAPTRHIAGVALPAGVQPAAIRVERSRSRRDGETTSQTAVTMWFGQGPALPGAGSQATVLRGALRLGAGVLGAAAVAVLTSVAAEREARLEAMRPRRISAGG